MWVILSYGPTSGQDRVAGGAEKRLRELQVGSPVELKFALTRPYGERRRGRIATALASYLMCR
jgi:hypothetical protein